MSVYKKKSLITHLITHFKEFSNSENTNSPTTDQHAPDKIEIKSYSGLSTYKIVKSSTFDSSGLSVLKVSFRIKVAVIKNMSSTLIQLKIFERLTSM